MVAQRTRRNRTGQKEQIPGSYQASRSAGVMSSILSGVIGVVRHWCTRWDQWETISVSLTFTAHSTQSSLYTQKLGRNASALTVACVQCSCQQWKMALPPRQLRIASTVCLHRVVSAARWTPWRSFACELCMRHREGKHDDDGRGAHGVNALRLYVWISQ